MTKIRQLIHPEPPYAVVAELVPGKSVDIKDKNLLNRLKSSGITISREFKEQNSLSESRIFPPKEGQDQALFAIAFEKFCFVHGLQQQGYSWEDIER